MTDPRDELRMERLLLSVAPAALSRFTCALEYDGDYKDLVEYVFHDIDGEACRASVIAHLRTAPGPIGVKVLSDVDDTMYANLIDQRYPEKTLYPGVLAFYDAVKAEPFAFTGIPITTLSARPNPVAGALEEASLRSLAEFTGRLCPSGLSGALVSSTAGTVETLLRTNLDLLSDDVPHGQEDAIGRVKFRNFGRFATLYPEYRYVFVGDSGQADALTAHRSCAFREPGRSGHRRGPGGHCARGPPAVSGDRLPEPRGLCTEIARPVSRGRGGGLRTPRGGARAILTRGGRPGGDPRHIGERVLVESALSALPTRLVEDILGTEARRR